MFHSNKSANKLEYFFNPGSIAVIGASNNPLKPGGRPVNFLLDKGYAGNIYPVNPSRETISGIRCYPSILDIPDTVDLAIISVAAKMVYNTLEQCVAKGVKAAVIFSSGFAEVGPGGIAEQKRISGLAEKSGMRILGPNCLGIVNTLNGVMATFAFIAELPQVDRKGLGFVTQSGAYGALIYASSLQRGVGFNYFVSVGNEADLEFADFLEYMVYDPHTRIIGGYLEGAKDGPRLRMLAEAALEKEKPVLVMKVGRSEAGRRAAASHTGSLAGSDNIYDAFFKQTGIVRIDGYTELISFTPLFLNGKLPQGKNTAIIATSGGAGVTITDLCESLGLSVIPLGEKARAKMEKVLPAFASTRNPVDLTAAVMTQPEIITTSLRALTEDPGVDIIIANVNFTSLTGEHPAVREFIEIGKSTDKFLVVCPFIFPGAGMDDACMDIMRAGIPVNPDILEAVKAIANLAGYNETLKRRKRPEYRIQYRNSPKPDLEGLLIPGATLSEGGAKAILEKYGIPAAREYPAASADEAADVAGKIGYPVAVKIDSPDIAHKTEAGGVKLNLNGETEVRKAFEEVTVNAGRYNPDARINGVLVQEMLTGGTEAIIGVTKDPVFGPVIMFGLGGIFVEALKDVSFRVAPVSPGDALDMIREIRGHALLKGFRGRPAVDTGAIVDAILKVSDLVTDHRDMIEELDINPLMVFPHGVKAADALLITADTIPGTDS